MDQNNNYRREIHGLNDEFNHTIGLGVRYEFTQSRPGLNPLCDFISCNRIEQGLRREITH
jgi:hypothetical protein